MRIYVELLMFHRGKIWIYFVFILSLPHQTNTFKVMDSNIGKILKECREYNSFTQEQVAKFLGLGRSAYANYESGEREPSLDILEKCANLYGCDLDLFFEEKSLSESNMLLCAFRVDDIAASDMNEIAYFKNIVTNYLKINNLLS